MINAYLQDDITLHVSRGYDAHGEPLVDTTVSVKGKYFEKIRLFHDNKGEAVYSSGYVMIQSRTVTLEDEVTINGAKHAIIQIEKPKDWSWGLLKLWVT